VSPELFNAFPRRSLTVRDAIATGFESTFSYRPRTKEQDHAIDRILSYFSEVLGERNVDTTLFASLPSGEQSLVLLFRALISKPPLVILDEVFAGMDEKMVGLSKEYIRNQLGENQAAVFVTHWKEEVPWGEDVVKTMSLTSQKP
jgi:ABC-type molybdenum transport system ATPase subunit/photorepair protein PhrA